MIVPTTQRAERVGGAVAHPCAAQRRLTLMGVNRFSYVHTSFPFDPEVMQAGSTRNLTYNFVYDSTFVSLVSPRGRPLGPKSPFWGLRRTSTPVAVTPLPTPGHITATALRSRSCGGRGGPKQDKQTKSKPNQTNRCCNCCCRSSPLPVLIPARVLRSPDFLLVH